MAGNNVCRFLAISRQQIVINLLKLKTLSLDDLDLSLKVDADEDDYLSFLTISC